MLQQKLKALLEHTVIQLQSENKLSPTHVAINVEHARNKQHGDFTTNVALLLAKKMAVDPLNIAALIQSRLPQTPLVQTTKIAAPGFINFYLTDEASYTVIPEILRDGERYGHTDVGKNKLVMIEFVSANPTGPLHVGHGRGAAFGDTVANLLTTAGFKVHREYYVNDAGRQMHVLALSVWLRYLELTNEGLHFPISGYQGDYIIDVARSLYEEYGERLHRSITELYRDLPVDADIGGNPEFYIDSLQQRAKNLLGTTDYQIVFNAGLEAILADIKEDLEEFGVIFNEWFREHHLIRNNDVQNGIEKLRINNCVYEQNEALWFNATKFGDEKDRVLMRSNGQTTYFASDVGYHLNKYERGFDLILDVFGADHHGYAPRIKGFLQAMNLDVNKTMVLLVQFAVLYRGKQKVQMSTRSGEFVTLRELRQEVGNDAARFFYIMRKNDQHLDFDLELAKTQSSDNPVYYIQYAHARICSVNRQLEEKQLTYEEEKGLVSLHLLQTEYEKDLLSMLLRYATVLQHAALNYEPHTLANYLRELSGSFHSYYNSCQFLVNDEPLRHARMCLINAVKQILANGLILLGVSCPESM